MTKALFLVAMAAAAVALVLSWYSGRRITRPIQAADVTAREVREGNLEAQAPVRATTKSVNSARPSTR